MIAAASVCCTWGHSNFGWKIAFRGERGKWGGCACALFFSLTNAPLARDALSSRWPRKRKYAFPPVKTVPLVSSQKRFRCNLSELGDLFGVTRGERCFDLRICCVRGKATKTIENSRWSTEEKKACTESWSRVQENKRALILKESRCEECRIT